MKKEFKHFGVWLSAEDYIDWGEVKVGNNLVGNFLRIGEGVQIRTKFVDRSNNQLSINIDMGAFRRLKQFESKTHKLTPNNVKSNGNGHFAAEKLTDDQKQVVEDFYKTYWDWVFKFYVKRGFDKTDEAEDLTAEFFESRIPIIINKQDKRYPKVNFKSWIFASAKNFGVDYIRKKIKIRNMTVDISDVYFDFVPPETDLGEAFSLIKECNSGLAVWLRLSGLNNIESAYVMGLNKNAFKVSLSRGIKRMKDFYSNTGFYGGQSFLEEQKFTLF